MKQIGIIGFGRFGKVLARILQKGFNVLVYDLEHNQHSPNVQFTDLENVTKAETVFLCVPIRSLEKIVIDICEKLNTNATVVDVCSVKLFPKETMEKYLPQNIGYIASHPLFGPDSFRSNQNLKMVMFPERDNHNMFHFWSQFFSGQGIEIIKINSDTHDKLAANSQGITHFIGRSLKEFRAKRSIIDTQGYRNLLDLVDQTCNDTWELYEDLQTYNPYTKLMINQINEAIQLQTKKLSKD